MPKRKDITGRKFRHMYVVESTGMKDANSNLLWLCLCDCGNTKIIKTSKLTSEKNGIKSCGCLVKNNGSHIRKHGKTRTHAQAYNTWSKMIDRCTNINNKDFHYYGGRGITVCERWMEFENFLEDMGNPSKNLTIDRIDNENGSYCKENCRWVTQKYQNRNKRNNIYIEYNGEKKLLIEWANDFNIGFYTLYSRIMKNKWSVEKALTTPIRGWSVGKPLKLYHAFGEEKTIDSWSKEHNIHPSTLRNRIVRGYSMEESLLL